MELLFLECRSKSFIDKIFTQEMKILCEGLFILWQFCKILHIL